MTRKRADFGITKVKYDAHGLIDKLEVRLVIVEGEEYVRTDDRERMSDQLSDLPGFV